MLGISPEEVEAAHSTDQMSMKRAVKAIIAANRFKIAMNRSRG